MQMKNDKKVQEMNILEQNLQGVLFQKQAFELERDETLSALKEIEKSGDDVFKIIGQLMIKTEKSKIKKELEEKQKIIGLRIEAFEKQENYLREKLDKIREELSDSLRK
jgi:prefoldin beta subunit